MKTELSFKETLYELHALRRQFADLEKTLKDAQIVGTFILEDIEVDPVAIVNAEGVRFIDAEFVGQTLQTKDEGPVDIEYPTAEEGPR